MLYVYWVYKHIIGDRNCTKFQSSNRDKTHKASVCPVAWLHTRVSIQQHARKPGDEPNNFRYDEWREEIKYHMQGSWKDGQRRPERGHLDWDLRTTLGWHRVQGKVPGGRNKQQGPEAGTSVGCSKNPRPAGLETSEWGEGSERWTRRSQAMSWRSVQRPWVWFQGCRMSQTGLK